MRKLLQQFKKIVFFDTETTGLDPEKDQIIELAAALVTENGIELKIDAFCKLPEGEKIPEKIVELTHITDDMLADKGIDYREACRIFCNMLHSDSEVLLVAHNIQFDLLFILEMFKHCGMVPKAPKLRALDSLTVYKDRAAYPHKLANAIEHYGLADKVQNSHRAIDDVLALYEVTKAMSEERGRPDGLHRPSGLQPEVRHNRPEIETDHIHTPVLQARVQTAGSYEWRWIL